MVCSFLTPTQQNKTLNDKTTNQSTNVSPKQELYGAMPRVRTPKIVWAATARRVLTMEWIDGVKLTNKEAMAAAGLSVTDFVDVGIECTLRQLLEHGFFHAGAVQWARGGWEGEGGMERGGRERKGGGEGEGVASVGGVI